MDLFRAALAVYTGPYRDIDATLLRTSDAKTSVLEAMEDLLEGMEFELGARLSRCLVGDAIGIRR
jgi:hypothetical protein